LTSNSFYKTGSAQGLENAATLHGPHALGKAIKKHKKAASLCAFVLFCGWQSSHFVKLNRFLSYSYWKNNV
jgi:hypothetical protein